MSKIHIVDPLKCMGCRYHFTLGDSVILAHRCWYPITVSMFDCPNRHWDYVNDDGEIYNEDELPHYYDRMRKLGLEVR